MILVLALLGVRLTKLMIGDSEYYASLAQDLHERERTIKAQRGRILDRNGVVLADNRTVCTISVIHSQIRDPEQVIKVLTKELKLDETAVRKRVEKVSSIERIAKNVEKEAGDRIREYDLAGGEGRRGLQTVLSVRKHGIQGAWLYGRRQSGDHRT